MLLFLQNRKQIKAWLITKSIHHSAAGDMSFNEKYLTQITLENYNIIFLAATEVFLVLVDLYFQIVFPSLMNILHEKENLLIAY